MTEFPNNPDDVANRMNIFDIDRHGEVAPELSPETLDAVGRIAVNAAHADRSGCPTSAELVDYADGELDDISSQKLAEHERRCVVCRGEIRTLRRMNAEWDAYEE